MYSCIKYTFEIIMWDSSGADSIDLMKDLTPVFLFTSAKHAPIKKATQIIGWPSLLVEAAGIIRHVLCLTPSGR